VPVYRDYRELLGEPFIDVVDIVTPNHLHGEMGVAALEARCAPRKTHGGHCCRVRSARRGRGTLGTRSASATSCGVGAVGAIKAMIDAGEIEEPLHAR
jgi:hypothetical protein